MISTRITSNASSNLWQRWSLCHLRNVNGKDGKMGSWLQEEFQCHQLKITSLTWFSAVAFRLQTLSGCRKWFLFRNILCTVTGSLYKLSLIGFRLLMAHSLFFNHNFRFFHVFSKGLKYVRNLMQKKMTIKFVQLVY